MATTQLHGVILRSWERNDADRGYAIYTEQFGKISAWAQGVRKPSSKLAGHLEPTSHVHLQVALGRHQEKILQSIARESYPRLRQSWAHTLVAQTCLELVDRMTSVHAADRRVYHLLLVLFRLLDGPAELDGGRLRSLTLSFFWKLLALAGYAPRISGCIADGTHHGALAFSPQRGGLLCATHRENGVIPMGDDDRELLRTCFTEPLAVAVHRPFPRHPRIRLFRIAEQYRMTVTDGMPLRSFQQFATLDTNA